MNTQKPSPKDKKVHKEPDQGKSSDVPIDEKRPIEQGMENAEINGQETEKGGFENKKEPTRYGDWETGGRCWDF